MEVRDDGGNEFHCEQLSRVCRICANPLRKSGKKSTVYKCSAKRELLRQLCIDTDQDDSTIHPTHICNICNTKLSRPGFSISSMSAFKWTVHANSDCTVCQHFNTLRDGGRPKTSTVRGRPPTAIEPLLSSAHPSFEDCQKLSLERFLPPTHNILLSDLQCRKCACVVDRPVMTACSNLLCCTCAVEMLRHKHPCPACKSNHSAPPISAGAVVIKVVSSLLLHCSSCGSIVELQKMKQHLHSNCTHAQPLPSPSKLTLGQMMARPPDAPASNAERKLATVLVKRISQSSPSTSSSVLSLPTAGQVRKIKQIHNVITTTI